MTVPTFAEVHRIESATAMRDLIRRDDLPRDPELVFRHFAASMRDSPEAYLERYRETLIRAVADHRQARAAGGDMRVAFAARAWLDSTRAALTLMCADLAPRLAGKPEQADGDAWCAALPEIEAIHNDVREAG